jgi:hypothetical protein
MSAHSPGVRTFASAIIAGQRFKAQETLLPAGVNIVSRSIVASQTNIFEMVDCLTKNNLLHRVS